MQPVTRKVKSGSVAGKVVAGAERSGWYSCLGAGGRGR